MRTLVFNLLVYPHTLKKLHEELEAANLSRPFPRYSEVRDLPYLDACVQEASRIHPPFALPFERVVPKGGLTVLGHYLPEGTVIGGSPYVVNRDQNTFGEDAEFWRPERWLEGDISHKRKLEGSMLTVCLFFLFAVWDYGKNTNRAAVWCRATSMSWSTCRNPGNKEVDPIPRSDLRCKYIPP
jgi:cytochrome P450